jgi:hypothetical protein
MNARLDRSPLVVALLSVGLHLAMRALGLATTTSMLSGSSTSTWDVVVGSVYVLAMLFATLVAPCLVLATALDALTKGRRARGHYAPPGEMGEGPIPALTTAAAPKRRRKR